MERQWYTKRVKGRWKAPLFYERIPKSGENYTISRRRSSRKNLKKLYEDFVAWNKNLFTFLLRSCYNEFIKRDKRRRRLRKRFSTLNSMEMFSSATLRKRFWKRIFWRFPLKLLETYLLYPHILLRKIFPMNNVILIVFC